MVDDRTFRDLSEKECINMMRTHPNRIITLMACEIDNIIALIPDNDLRLNMQQSMWRVRGSVSKMQTPGGKLLAYATFLRTINETPLQELKKGMNNE
jgi:hypothetical protein